VAVGVPVGAMEEITTGDSEGLSVLSVGGVVGVAEGESDM